MFKQLLLATLATTAIACGKTGAVKFEMAIANENDRIVTVTNGAATGTFTIDNVIIIVDRVVLKGDGEAIIIDTPTPFRFEDLGEIIVGVDVAEGNYTSLEVTIGVADAATAAAALEPNIQDRSFHLEGALDGTGIVTYAPAAQTITFNTAITVSSDAEVVPEILIDLEALLTGVDYALAENVAGELALTEDNAVNQSPIISANVAAAWTLILE